MTDWFSGKIFKRGNNQRSPLDRNRRWVALLMLLTVVASWLMSGVFVVQENQQAIVSRLGVFQRMAEPGVHWILPYPIEQHEIVSLADGGTVEISTNYAVSGKTASDTAVFTKDSAMVHLRLLVQYRLRDLQNYLQTQQQDPEQVLNHMGVHSIREVLAQMDLLQVLGNERDQIAPNVHKHLQGLLDKASTGIELVSVNLQDPAVRVPDAVGANFEELARVNADNERLKNDALDYANRAIPEAVAKVEAMQVEAKNYKTHVVSQAHGDAERFSILLPQYKKAPQATREYLYHETMQQIFANTSKVINTTSGKIAYLPSDRQQQDAPASAGFTPASAANTTASAGAVKPDLRSRDSLSLRQRP